MPTREATANVPVCLDDYAGRRVLVTGGSGFIGTAVAKALCARDADVHVVSRGAQEVPGTTVHRGDLAERDFVGDVCRRVAPHCVFHLAGRTNAAKGVEHVLPTFQTNAVGTLNLLLGLVEHAPDCRLVSCASMEELWNDTPTASSPYGVSKFVASTYVGMFRALYGLDAVSLRVYFVYGPGHQPSEKLMPFVLGELLAGRYPALRSAGRGMDWVFLDDVARAFLLAGLSIAGPDEPIDVGSGCVATIGDVVARLADIVGVPVPGSTSRAAEPTAELSPVADLTAAEHELGWRPSTNLDEGLAATVAWYRQGG